MTEPNMPVDPADIDALAGVLAEVLQSAANELEATRAQLAATRTALGPRQVLDGDTGQVMEKVQHGYWVPSSEDPDDGWDYSVEGYDCGDDTPHEAVWFLRPVAAALASAPPTPTETPGEPMPDGFRWRHGVDPVVGQSGEHRLHVHRPPAPPTPTENNP